MAGLTDAELFGNTSPQAPPPPKTTGLTDKELLSNNTSPQGGQEDNRSLMELLQAAGSSISNMTVDDVISYLEENGELPGGLGGAASGALIGFLSPVPGGALIGSIIGGAVGSGVGSMTSDVLMSEKEGTEALSDVDVMEGLKEAAISLGIDLATLGLGRYVGKPIWNALKNRKVNPEQVLRQLSEGVPANQVGRNPLIPMASEAADVGTQQARYQSQELAFEGGETLSKFNLGLTDSLGAMLENLGRHSIGGGGVFKRSQDGIINIVHDKLGELVNLTALSADQFGKAYTLTVSAGKKALQDAYKVNQSKVFSEMSRNTIPYRAAKESIDGWAKKGANRMPNGQSKLTPNETDLIEKLSVLVEGKGSPRQLMAVDEQLKELFGAALKSSSTSKEYRRLTLFRKRVKAGIALNLKEEVSPAAKKAYMDMNREFHRGINAIMPKVNEGYMKKMDPSSYTRIGQMFAGGGDAVSIKAGMESLRESYAKMSRTTRGNLPIKNIEEAEKAVATGYITEKLGALTVDRLDPRKFVKEAVNLTNPTYAAATKAVMGKNYTNYKKLVNLMAHAHDTPKAGMFSLVQRAKEATAAGKVGAAIITGGKATASAGLHVSGIFVAPWFFSKVAMNPKRVNKMLAINAMGEGRELVKTKVALSLINDVLTEAYDSGMSQEDVEARLRSK